MHGAGKVELSQRTVDVVSTGLWKADEVLLEIASIDGVGAESRSQFEANSLNARYEVLAFICADRWTMVQPSSRTGFKNLLIESGGFGLVLSRRIAPTPPRIAHLDGETLVAQGVEVQNSCRGVAVTAEAKVGYF